MIRSEIGLQIVVDFRWVLIVADFRGRDVAGGTMRR
jgi:hypothetical protein